MINFIIPLLILLSAFSVKSQSLNITGSWSIFVPSSSISEAGNDYNTTLTSSLNQTLLDISVPVTNVSWRVDVHKQDFDFFGDGTRIPLIVVSPLAKKGHVDHVYNDHASILKFIEKNWGATRVGE